MSTSPQNDAGPRPARRARRPRRSAPPPRRWKPWRISPTSRTRRSGAPVASSIAAARALEVVGRRRRRGRARWRPTGARRAPASPARRPRSAGRRCRVDVGRRSPGQLPSARCPAAPSGRCGCRCRTAGTVPVDVDRRARAAPTARPAPPTTSHSARAVTPASRPSCQARNVRPSASSSARLATGLPTPCPARPSWNSRIGRSSWHGRRRLQQRGHLAGVQRVDAGVALGGREQRRRVARAVDDVVVRRVGVQPGELLGDVGVAVLVGPQAGDEELREADHVEQRHAAPHGAAQVGALRQRDADEQPAVGAAEHGEALARREPGGDQPVGGGVEVVEHVLLVRSRRPAWCHASPSSSPPRSPAMAYAPPAAHHAAICGDHTGVSAMANPP